MPEIPDIREIVLEILKLRGRQVLTLPEEVLRLIQSQNPDSFQQIPIFFATSEEVDAYKSSPMRYLNGPYYFQKPGSLVGMCSEVTSPRDLATNHLGYKLYLFSDGNLGLFSYEEKRRVFGRVSGPGYTGSEDNRVWYTSRLENEFLLTGDAKKQISLEI